MKRILLPFLFSFCAVAVHAQPYGNQWIDYGKQYWSFKVAADGLLKIDSTTLANAGFPVATVDPRTIQIFAKERQVPLYVAGESDGVFNTNDFIEFFAARNDAWKDLPLWDDPAHQNNPVFSLYNDTLRYFLTWGAAPTTERVVPFLNTDYASQPARDWFLTDTYFQTYDRYYQGKRTSIQASSAFFGEAEGYFHSAELFNDGTNPNSWQQDFPFPFTNPSLVFGTPAARIKVVTAGTNNVGGDNCDDHHLQVLWNGYFKVDTVFRGYQLNKFEFTMPYVTLSANNTLRLRAVHDLGPCGSVTGAYPDRQAHSYTVARYARLFQMAFQQRLEMFLPDQPGDPLAHIEFTQYSQVPIMYVWGDTVRRVLPELNNGVWRSMLPADALSDTTRIWMQGEVYIEQVPPLSLVNGTGYFTDFAAAVQDSAVLIVSQTGLMNAAAAYAAYRETSPVNPYNTVLADVEELYMQYGGGVRKHPMAIRGFVDHLIDVAPTKPEGLLLIGKAIQAHRTNFQSGTRFNQDTASIRKSLVPTLGYPPSDIAYTLGLEGDGRVMEVPVGRIAARDEQEVLDYLDKVQAFEGNQAQPEAWMKNILHFRGGFNQTEWVAFDQALSVFQQHAEDTMFVGRVTKFVKNGSGLIQPASADSVADMIAAGTTLMTFFAHATGGGFDITVDNPQDYEWNGKYPMMIGNSCYTGNIHLLNNASASETFVRPAGVGAVAFMSPVDIGLSNLLQQYCGKFYQSFSTLNYGRPIGQHMKESVFDMMNIGGTDLNRINAAQSFTLHGDPMLVLNSPAKPEFVLNTEDIRLLPDPVTADADSFQVQATVRNIGRGTLVPISVSVQRTLVEEGLAIQPVVRQLSLFDEGTATFTLPVLADSGGSGQNALTVRTDLDPDLVDEDFDDLFNNQVDTTFLIVSGDINPVYPYEYAVTPDAGPALKATTGDPFSPARTYVFQIDTTDLFNSPLMEQGQVTAPGGVITWQPQSVYTVNSTDSVVFFWRCSVDSAGNNGYNWKEFSFQHLTDRRGWGQAHHFQFKKNNYQQIVFDRPGRDFDYFVGQRKIAVNLKGNTGTLCDWFIDLSWQDGNGCGGTPAFHVAVIDPFNFTPWGTKCGSVNPDHDFGNANGDCVNHPCNTLNRPINYFSFRQNNFQTELQFMDTMLTQDIPDEHYVLIYTYLFLNKDAAPTHFNTIRGILGSWGADDLLNDVVPDSVPYIFLVKKGDPSTAVESYGQTLTDFLDFNSFVNVTSRSGTISAPLAGPAFEWNGMYWNDVLQPTDSTTMNLVGRNIFGAEQQLHTRPSPEDSLTAFTSPTLSVDANTYPDVRLIGNFAQTSELDTTPSQLKRWHLLGAPAPECAIDPPLGFVEVLDSIFEGQPGTVMVAVNNISEFDMDSLLLAAWVVDATNQRTLVHYRYNAPLPAGGVARDTIVFNTDGFAGVNTLIIEANPLDTLTGLYDQIEQYHFNNIAHIRFMVQDDRENPMLDVTFDGMHILDGDVVSARPEIQVTLDDENTTLLLDAPSDTIHFKVFLTDPGNVTRRIYFREGTLDIMQFIPADGSANISKVMYRPVFATDGSYTLTVQASDISRNQSGDNDYKVRFEVINKPTITEVLNYPNPFTTSTRFVFTVTGQQPPTYMKIQIMTISGRVVREVGLDELGPIRVGRNITEFAWDGTDAFGDRLGRGVYLYRVVAKLNGEEIEYRSTSAGGYFERGVGKMYLLR
jgi:hypothetical protein